MSDSQKYYYIRLKDNFFDTNEIVVLESMQDGYLYSNILLKLYLRSLKDNGKLMFNDRIPYNPQMIATITRHQVGTVEKALQIFKEMGLIEVLDNGAIYMLDIQNYIGKSSTEADRKRNYRNAIDQNKKMLELGQMSDDPPPEIEIDIELDINKDIYIDKQTEKKKKKTEPRHKYGEYQHVMLTDSQLEKLKNEYSNYMELITFLDEYIEMKGYKAKNHYLAIKKWVVDAVNKQNKRKPKSKPTYTIPEINYADVLDDDITF